MPIEIVPKHEQVVLIRRIQRSPIAKETDSLTWSKDGSSVIYISGDESALLSKLSHVLWTPNLSLEERQKALYEMFPCRERDIASLNNTVDTKKAFGMAVKAQIVGQETIGNSIADPAHSFQRVSDDNNSMDGDSEPPAETGQ